MISPIPQQPDLYEVNDSYQAVATDTELTVCGRAVVSSNPRYDAQRLAALFGWSKL